MKRNDYLCPKCKGHLNAGGYVIFATKNRRKKKGLILLNPEIGNYSYKHHDDYIFEHGEMVEFFCPICQTDLQSKQNPDYISVTMIDHQGMEYKVFFSRKAGEKSTYVLSDENVETFGNDSADFEKLFSEEETETGEHTDEKYI